MTQPAGAAYPPTRTLLGPGPSEIHPRVLLAMAKTPVGYLDPFFFRVMDEVQEMLRGAFRTKNEVTLAITGSGSAGQEALVANLVEPGDSVLVCVNGFFSTRSADMAERAGGEVAIVERPWGEVFRPDDLKDALARVKPKVVVMVMAETSTGALQPIEEISDLVHEAGAMLLVDAVTSLAGVPVEVDRWNIDAIYSGTQKCLSCPPGLSPISLSTRAMEAIRSRKEKVRSWYLDIAMIADYWGQDRKYHHTPPVNMIYALHEALRVVHEEGLEACFARHLQNHELLKKGLSAQGITYAAEEGHQLPQLNAVRVPEGIDEAAVRRALVERYGIEIGGGLGALKGKAWRIGLMGYSSRKSNVLALLAAIEELLSKDEFRVA